MKLVKENTRSNFVVSQLNKAKSLIYLAAGLSFLFSIYIFFSGDKLNGIYVGLWVPSILSAGVLLLGGKDHG